MNRPRTERKEQKKIESTGFNFVVIAFTTEAKTSEGKWYQASIKDD